MDIKSIDKLTFDMLHAVLGVRIKLQNLVENLDQSSLDELAIELKAYNSMSEEYKERLAVFIQSLINEENTEVRGEVNEEGIRIN
jgi:hypothetical protein